MKSFKYKKYFCSFKEMLQISITIRPSSLAERVKSCSHCCQRPQWLQWEEGKTQERSQSLHGMEKAWGMIKCVGFDKTGAWYFSSESNGALLNSLMLKKMQTSYGNLQMSASLQTQVLMVWGQVLVNLQLKCARGVMASSGGCPPAPRSTSQRHTHRHTQSVPQSHEWAKPWGWFTPQNIREKHQI